LGRRKRGRKAKKILNKEVLSANAQCKAGKLAAGLGHLQINAALGDKTFTQALALARPAENGHRLNFGPHAGMWKMYSGLFGGFNIFKA